MYVLSKYRYCEIKFCPCLFSTFDLGRYSNGRKLSGLQMVQYSRRHLNTGLNSLVFRWLDCVITILMLCNCHEDRVYSGDFNIWNIWKPNILVSRFQMVFSFSNGWAKAITSLVPTFWKPTIQNVCFMFGFQMVGLFGIQMAFKSGLFGEQLSTIRKWSSVSGPSLYFAFIVFCFHLVFGVEI